MNLRKLIIYAIVISAVSIFQGCDNFITDNDWNNDRNTIHGSGRLVTLQENFTGFHKISLSHSFKADIYQSDNYSVTIRIDDNILEYLESDNSGDKLYMGLSDQNNYNDITLTAEIGVPDITTLDLSGASAIELYGFDFQHSLNIYLTGASSLKGNINAGDVLLDMSGASYINLAGKADKIDIYGSGASTIEMPNFLVDEAGIYLTGASYSKIIVNNLLNIHLTGASVLYYSGNPTIGDISIDGVSKIIKY